MNHLILFGALKMFLHIDKYTHFTLFLLNNQKQIGDPLQFCSNRKNTKTSHLEV